MVFRTGAAIALLFSAAVGQWASSGVWITADAGAGDVPIVENGTVAELFSSAAHATTTGELPLLFDDSIQSYPSTLPTFTWHSGTPNSTLSYTFAATVGIAERGGSNSYYDLIGSTNLSVSIPRSGKVPPADAPETFTVFATCAVPYTALFTFVFTFHDDGGSLSAAKAIDPVVMSFAWICTLPPVCPEECPAHGACVGSRCSCNPGFIGPSCSVEYSLPTYIDVCPGAVLPLKFAFPAPTSTADYSEAWLYFGEATAYYATQWFYFQTKTTDIPTLVKHSVNGSMTMAFPELSVPGDYLMIVYKDNDYAVIQHISVHVKGWDECGNGNPTGVTVAMPCESKSLWWWNCSHGCLPETVLRDPSGEISSDIGGRSFGDSSYANEALCKWTIDLTGHGNDYNVIYIDFVNFDIETSDSVLVESPLTTAAVYRGSNVPTNTLKVLGKTATITLTADEWTTSHGFVVRYRSGYIMSGVLIAVAVTVPIVSVALIVTFALLTVSVVRARRRVAEIKHSKPADAMDAELRAAVLRDDAKELAEALEKKRSLYISKTALDFGLHGHEAFPVGTTLRDTVVLENRAGLRALPFIALVPSDEHKFTVTVTPSFGHVPVHGRITLTVGMTLNYTTSVKERIALVISDGQSTSMRAILEMQLDGAISERLAPDDITLHTPPLASGAFGSVYRGQYRGRTVAVKVLRHQFDLRQVELDQFRKEVELYTKLRCPLIVEFIGACNVPGRLCLVMELLDRGNLAVLALGKERMSLRLKLKMLLNIAQALEWLHANKVIHRDMKPANILVVSTKWRAVDVLCKLSDFGTSRSVVSVNEYFNFTCGIGTPVFMAPELLEGATEYSGAVDIYSFGITCWEVIARAEPWKDVISWNLPSMIIGGQRPPIPEDEKVCPKQLGQLICQCWDSDPHNRPTAEEVASRLKGILIDMRVQFVAKLTPSAGVATLDDPASVTLLSETTASAPTTIATSLDTTLTVGSDLEMRTVGNAALVDDTMPSSSFVRRLSKTTTAVVETK